MFVDISGVWAIEPNAAREYLKVYASVLARKDAGLPLNREAVEAATGRTLDNPSGQSKHGAVGVINCEGLIVARGNMFSQVSGMASVDAMRAQFDALNADSDISGIALCFNSPGGSISGIADFADHIRASKGKPVIAYSDGLMASAAYWLGSAADQVVCSRTAMLGSIGTVMRFEDDSKLKADIGIEDVEILDSNAPLKSQEHAQGDVRAYLQGLVNDGGNVFRAAVAKFRGVSAATVKSDFGRGGMMLGKKAVAAGLADRVATFDTVLQELAGGKLRALPSKQNMAAASAEGEDMGFLEDLMVRAGWKAPEDAAAAPPQQAALPTPPLMAAVGMFTIDGMTPDEVRAKLKAADDTQKQLLAAQVESQIEAFAAKIPPAAMEAATKGYEAALAAGNGDSYVAALDAVTAVTPGAGPANRLVAGKRPDGAEVQAAKAQDDYFYTLATTEAGRQRLNETPEGKAYLAVQ